MSTILRCENLDVLVVVGRCGKAVYDFSAIEGNVLAFEEVNQLALGGKITATRKAQQEVLYNIQVTG